MQVGCVANPGGPSSQRCEKKRVNNPLNSTSLNTSDLPRASRAPTNHPPPYVLGGFYFRTGSLLETMVLTLPERLLFFTSKAKLPLRTSTKTVPPESTLLDIIIEATGLRILS